MKILPLPGYGDSRYAKFYNAILGSVISYALAWAASRGFGNCVSAPGGGEVCTYWGYSESDINMLVVAVVTALFVHQSPPNTPTRQDT